MKLINQIAGLLQRFIRAEARADEWLAHGAQPLHEWALYDWYRPDRPRKGPRLERPVMGRKIDGIWQVRPLTSAEVGAVIVEREQVVEQASRSL